MADFPLFSFTTQEDWYGEISFQNADDGNAPLSLAGRTFEMVITPSAQGGSLIEPVRTLTMAQGGGLAFKTGGTDALVFRVGRVPAREFARVEYTADILEVVDSERHLFMPVRIRYGEPSSLLAFVPRLVGVSVTFSARAQPIITPVAIAGRQGIPGATILTGTAPPVPATGKDGDYFIEDRTASSQGRRMYGPKAGGAWPGTPWVIQVTGIADVPGLSVRLDEKADAQTARAELGAVKRSIGASLRDRMSVKDFGSTGSGVAQRIGTRLGTEDLAAIQALYPFVTAPSQENEYVAFQAAIDALPAVGGEILIPAGNYSTLNTSWAALLNSRGKLIRWMAYGATNLPKKSNGLAGNSGQVNALPGVLFDTRPFLMQEGSGGRPSNAWTIADAGVYFLPDTLSQQDSIHEVIGHLADDANTKDSEFRGFSAHLSTDHRDPSHSIKAFRGGVILNGGSAKGRSIRLATESRNNHNGIAVGAMFSAWRSWVDPTTYRNTDANGVSMPQSAAVIAQAGAGIRYAFLAQGFDAKNRIQGAFSMTFGAQATLPEFAALDLHAGGAGHILNCAPDEESPGDTASIYRMERTGRMHAKGGYRSSLTALAVLDQAVASVPCPSTSGLVMIFCPGLSGGFLIAQYRTAASAGTSESLTGISIGSAFAAPGTAVNYTGTTGASGKITVGIYGTNLQIENRNGNARAFHYTWIG